MKNNTVREISKSFDYNGGFYYWCGKAFDIMLLSIFWIVGSLPVFTIGVASSALYYSTCKSIKTDEQPVSKSFWHSYKDSFKEGTVHGVLIIVSLFVLLLNFGIVRAKLSGNLKIGMMMFYIALITFVLMISGYVFPLISRFRMPFGWYTKVAIYSVFKNLHISILLMLLITVMYYLAYKCILLMVFIPGIYVYVSTFILEKIIVKLQKTDIE